MEEQDLVVAEDHIGGLEETGSGLETIGELGSFGTPPPVEEAPITPDFRETFFSKAKQELGKEFASEDEFFSLYKSLQGERDKYKGDYEKTQNALPPALREVAHMLEAKGFNGTDQELMAETINYLERQSRDYAKLANDKPEAVWREHLRNSNSAYSDTQIDTLIARKQKTFMAEAVNDGLDDDEAAAYVKEQMALEALAFVPTLESQKVALRFKPEGARTQDEIAALQQANIQSSVNSTYNAIEGFKGISLGEAGLWELPLVEADGKTIKAEHLDMLNEIATPGAWFQKFLNPDGSENKAAMLEYEATRRFAATAASRRVEDARGLGNKEVVRDLRNPRVEDKTNKNPISNGAQSMIERIKQLSQGRVQLE